MRARISGGFFLLGVLLLTVDPVAGQPGGGKFGRGGFGGPPGSFGQPGQPGTYTPQPGGFGQSGGGGFGRTPDPERTFNFFSRGADAIDFGQMPPEQKVFVKGAFERMGLPAPPDSGVMTKSQFVAAFAQAQAAKAAQSGTPTPGGFGQQPGSFGQQPGGFGQPSGYGQPGGFGQQPGGFGGPPGGFGGKGGFQMTDEDMLRRFRESDRNQDGMLAYDEASGRTRENWAEVDVNRRGYVTFDEYKGYMQRRMAAFAGGSPGGPSGYGGQPSFGSGQPQFGGQPGFGGSPQFGGPTGGDFRGTGEGGPPGFGGFGRRDEKKADDFTNVAIRYGKLPPGLPEWFAEYDQDKDGQINMYEWRTVGGKTTAEFREWDANADGLIAPQELIRVTASKAEAERLAAIEAGETPSKSSGRFGGGSMGGRPGFGSPGGFGGGPPMMGKGGFPGSDSRPSREERREEKGERPDRGKNNPFANGGKRGN